MKYRIDIDCPPGDPRPGDLIADVIKGTGLPLREDTGYRFFGWWTWDYSDVDPELWKRAWPKIRRRLVRLYEQGVIRYGHVSRARGEKCPDCLQGTDAGAPGESMEPIASDQQRDGDAFAMLSLERVATSRSGTALVRASLMTGNTETEQP